jgi:hypothetical protein
MTAKTKPATRLVSQKSTQAQTNKSGKHFPKAGSSKHYPLGEGQ